LNIIIEECYYYSCEGGESFKRNIFPLQDKIPSTTLRYAHGEIFSVGGWLRRPFFPYTGGNFVQVNKKASQQYTTSSGLDCRDEEKHWQFLEREEDNRQDDSLHWIC